MLREAGTLGRSASVGRGSGFLVLGALSAIGVGVGTALSPMPAAAIVLTVVLCSAAIVRPSWALFAVAASTGLYLGLFVNVRLSIGALPLSALDLAPVVLALALIGYAVSGAAPDRHALPSSAWIGIALLACGLTIGAMLGRFAGTELVPFFRVVRIEVVLLLVLVLSLMGGRYERWRSALGTGLYVAGLIAALTTIVGVVSAEVTGRSLFAFLSDRINANSLELALGTGALGSARDNLLPTFIMLPALAAALVRLSRLDLAAAGLIAIAAALSLSRGLWVSVLLVIALVSVVHLSHKRLRATGIRFLAVIGAVVATVAIAVGGLVNARLEESLSANADTSRQYRTEETKLLVEILTDSPRAVLAGAGAGTVIDAPYREAAGLAEASPIPENHILGRWLNFGPLSIAGLVLILGGAAVVGHRYIRWSSDAARDTGDHDFTLAAMTLSLPPLLLTGFIGGTLMQLPVTMPMLLLAGSGFSLSVLHESSVQDAG